MNPNRFSLIVLTILLFFHSPVVHCAETKEQKLLRIHFFDVGYGDCILVQFPDSSTMMIDNGEPEVFAQVVKQLRALGVEKIDTAIITHPHVNHFEGFFQLLVNFPITRVFINGDKNAEQGYRDLLEEFKKKGIPVTTLKRGQKINHLPKGVRLEVLHPGKLTGSPNENSLVALVTYKKIAILLMADVEVTQQDELFKLYPRVSKADVIKVPHHGGPLSSRFAQVFKDKIFIISTGPNQWGNPGQADLDKLNGTVLRTDGQGTIVLETDGQEVWPFSNE